ncbi:MAG: PepSY domain-containing protein, partial [Gemmataceae bacterium]
MTSSLLESPSGPPSLLPAARRKPRWKSAIFLLRRGHLYLGLFLFPWAILYGVTAFLFNHPTAFSEQPTASFGPKVLIGTPLETLPNPQAIAEAVLVQLNQSKKPVEAYTLDGPARFGGRDFAFATAPAEGATLNLLIDLKTGHGTVRSTPTRERKEPEKAPFAVGSPGNNGRGERGDRGERPRASSDGIRLPQPPQEQFKAAIPAILQATGFSTTGTATVTSVPDVLVPIRAGDRIWLASYNPITGSVSGRPADEPNTTELGWRR